MISLARSSYGGIFPAGLWKPRCRPVVAYDRLGFGNSDPYPGTLDADFIRGGSKIQPAALRAQLKIGRNDAVRAQRRVAAWRFVRGRRFPILVEAVMG